MSLRSRQYQFDYRGILVSIRNSKAGLGYLLSSNYTATSSSATPAHSRSERFGPERLTTSWTHSDLASFTGSLARFVAWDSSLSSPPRKTEDEESEYEAQQFYQGNLVEAGFRNISHLRPVIKLNLRAWPVLTVRRAFPVARTASASGDTLWARTVVSSYLRRS